MVLPYLLTAIKYSSPTVCICESKSCGKCGAMKRDGERAESVSVSAYPHPCRRGDGGRVEMGGGEWGQEGAG